MKNIILMVVVLTSMAFSEIIKWDNRESVLKVLNKDGTNLKYLSKEFQDDEGIVLAAVSDKRYSMQCGYDDPDTNRKRDSQVIRYASKRLQESKIFILKAVAKNGFVIKHSGKKF